MYTSPLKNKIHLKFEYWFLTSSYEMFIVLLPWKWDAGRLSYKMILIFIHFSLLFFVTCIFNHYICMLILCNLCFYATYCRCITIEDFPGTYKTQRLLVLCEPKIMTVERAGLKTLSYFSLQHSELNFIKWASLRKISDNAYSVSAWGCRIQRTVSMMYHLVPKALFTFELKLHVCPGF